jgi:pimeloyl-ACP methyl ester carboxylesterase
MFAASVIGWILAAQIETSGAPPENPWPGASYLGAPEGRIHYFDIGPKDGDVIFLFHGSGSGLAYWQEGFADALAKSYRVVAFDYYGNGFSDRGHSWSYGYDLWARQAIAVLDALQIERAFFVGHSVGGVVASITAVDYPTRADGVATIGTGIAIDPAQMLPLVPGIGEVSMGLNDAISESFSSVQDQFYEQAHSIRGTRAGFLVYIRRQYTIDGLRLVRGLFDQIEKPSLHISGTNDPSIPHAAAKALAEQTGGKFVAFEGAGHYVHLDAPNELADEIDEFIKEIASAH